MFDRKTFLFAQSGGDHHHHRTEVHEHRAPTDKSVELLRDMEKAARDKILETIRLEDAGVDCVVVHQRPMQTGDDEFAIRYRLGGETVTLRHTVERRRSESAGEYRQRVVDELVDLLARNIAVRLLRPAFAKSKGVFQ